MQIVSCGYDCRHPQGFQIKRPNGSGDYLLLVVRSAAAFILNNKTYITKGNAAIIFKKGTPQRFGSADKEYINDWIHFECDENDINAFHELGIEFDKILEFQSVLEISNLIKLICFERYSSNKNAKQTVMTLFKLIMLKFSDYCEQNPIVNTKYQKQLNDLRNDIFTNPQENWKVEEISKKLLISKSYLQHQYKRLFNTSIKKDVVLSRIEYSKYLLFSTDYTISAISTLCGYENDVHFMRTFKKETGVTPTEYRKSLKYFYSAIEES